MASHEAMGDKSLDGNPDNVTLKPVHYCCATSSSVRRHAYTKAPAHCPTCLHVSLCCDLSSCHVRLPCPLAWTRSGVCDLFCRCTDKVVILRLKALLQYVYVWFLIYCQPQQPSFTFSTFNIVFAIKFSLLVLVTAR